MKINQLKIGAHFPVKNAGFKEIWAGHQWQKGPALEYCITCCQTGTRKELKKVFCSRRKPSYKERVSEVTGTKPGRWKEQPWAFEQQIS